MSNKQTTAVSQLIELIEKHDKHFSYFFKAEIEQAKAIERKQIETSWMEGKQDKTFGDNVFEDAEKYFTSTFITE